jgi:hypothetical protein
MKLAWALLGVVATLTACGDNAASGGGPSTGGGGAAVTDGGHSTSNGGANTGAGGAFASGGSGPTGGSAPVGGCAGHDYALCEDFEGADVGGVPDGWIKRHPYTDDPNAVVESEVGVATDQAHWGSKSLKSSSAECAQTRAQKSLAPLGATAGTHWGRIFFRVQTPAPLTDPGCGCYYHETFVGLGPNATDESRVVDTTESPAGDVQFLYNIPDDSFGKGTPADYAYESVWRCAEWYVDATTQSYQFYLDGEELINFENEPAANMNEFSDISVGAICYILPLAPTDFTAWFDDLAIDDQRIGCDP